MLTLDSGLLLCRPCAGKVAAFLRGATTAFLNGLWGPGTTSSTTARERPSTGASQSESDEEVFARFKAGVVAVIRPEDFQAHWDLGVAYAEMGLHADAIREVATSLDERASQQMAQAAFALIFTPPRAVQGALDVVVAALRR
jgi:hypothetical protein